MVDKPIPRSGSMRPHPSSKNNEVPTPATAPHPRASKTSRPSVSPTRPHSDALRRATRNKSARKGTVKRRNT